MKNISYILLLFVHHERSFIPTHNHSMYIMNFTFKWVFILICSQIKVIWLLCNKYIIIHVRYSQNIHSYNSVVLQAAENEIHFILLIFYKKSTTGVSER